MVDRFIYVYRHAKAVRDDAATPDFDRALAARGVEAAHRMAQYMNEADIRPQLILCSTSRRTRETLAPVVGAIEHDCTVMLDRKLYLASRERLMSAIARLDDKTTRVMLIGHNPGLQELIQYLAGSGHEQDMARVREKFPAAGLATLRADTPSWAALRPGGCELIGLVPPRTLESA